jgi:DNA-binding CsgD family transcriptional regulator
MIFPILPYGVVGMVLDAQPSEEEELSHFARAIGSMLALQLSRIPIYGSSKAKDGKKKIGRQSIELTERQKIIHQLMLKGFTNAQIAAEVGYSESLVRQETIQIFRVLGVSDRVRVLCADVEEVISQPEHLHGYDAACARGFGPPQQTLAWASALVRSGGSIVVSEPPPGSPDRWANINLGLLGVSSPERLGPVAMFHVEH